MSYVKQEKWLRMIGTVKWFDEDKRFGFINGRDGVDYYFNAQDLVASSPDTGDTVTFAAKTGKKGMRASQVLITTRASPSSYARPRFSSKRTKQHNPDLVSSLARWVVTDHSGLSESLAYMPPDLGFLASIKFILTRFIVSMLTGLAVIALSFLGIYLFFTYAF